MKENEKRSPMTKEELKTKTDEELLAMFKKAKGHTNSDFMEYMNCTFSYSHLRTQLKERGYEDGWHKVSNDFCGVVPREPEIIVMKKSKGKTKRHVFLLEESIAEEWKKFNENIPFNTVTLGAAMRRFMDDVNCGKIRFVVEVGNKDPTPND